MPKFSPPALSSTNNIEDFPSSANNSRGSAVMVIVYGDPNDGRFLNKVFTTIYINNFCYLKL